MNLPNAKLAKAYSGLLVNQCWIFASAITVAGCMLPQVLAAVSGQVSCSTCASNIGMEEQKVYTLQQLKGLFHCKTSLREREMKNVS